MKKLLTLLLIVLAWGYASAQEEQEGGGAIENVEIEIVKVKQITMPKANRNFEKIPPRPAEPLAPAMNYDVRTINFTAPDYNPVVKPLKLKDETLSKIYGNYVSLGYGNYNSPFASLSISSKRDQEKYYGLDFLHHSFGKGPVDGNYSGSGYSKLNGYLSAMTPKLTAEVGATYENMFNHFYGYKTKPTQEGDIRQSFNIIGLNGSLSNTKAADFNYKLSADVSYLRDRFETSEAEVGVHFNSRYQVNKTQAFSIKSDYFFIDRKLNLVGSQNDPILRNLFKVNPTYEFTIYERFRLSAGLNVAVQNVDKKIDTVSSKAVHIYPDVWAHTEIGKSIDVYAGITGDIEKVDLHSLARENQWLSETIYIANTNKAFEFRGGVQGKIARKVSFNVGTSIVNFKNMYFYENEFNDRSKFRLSYDNTVRTSLFAELGVAHADKVNINMRGDVYKYDMKTFEYAWMRPTYKFGLYSSYKLFDKVLLTANLITQGGAKAYDYETNKIVSLKSAVNLEAKVRYFISKPISVYVEGNNLLNNNYPIYLYYPARGIMISAGFSWSF